MGECAHDFFVRLKILIFREVTADLRPSALQSDGFFVNTKVTVIHCFCVFLILRKLRILTSIYPFTSGNGSKMYLFLDLTTVPSVLNSVPWSVRHPHARDGHWDICTQPVNQFYQPKMCWDFSKIQAVNFLKKNCHFEVLMVVNRL